MAVIQRESVEVPVIAHKRLGSRIGPGSERSAGFTGHRNPGGSHADVLTAQAEPLSSPRPRANGLGRTRHLPMTETLNKPGSFLSLVRGLKTHSWYQALPAIRHRPVSLSPLLCSVLRAWSGQGKETRHSGRKGTAKLFAGEMLLYVGNSQKWTPSRTDKQDTESIYEAFLYLRNENQKGNRE